MASEKLAKYRSMRDFSKTVEPIGTLPIKRSKRLRFVIQKHAARRLHFDFRLELDGTFKSWAVTKGPSLDPKDKRLAVAVEDHPLDYGDFEGTIPKGQYGGGTVQLWDRGYWQPRGERPPQEQLQRGELKFSLDGERLRGHYVLVRMKHDREGSKRTNWLLIKQRDEHARGTATSALLAQDRSVASGRTMAEIAAGTGRGPAPFMLAARKAAPPDAIWNSKKASSEDPVARRHAQRTAGHNSPDASPRSKKSRTPMPAFVEPELCKSVARPPQGSPWAHEVKLDGYRMQLRVEDGTAVLRTRKGLDWSAKFHEIVVAASRLPDCMIDGEIVALDRHGAPDFGALQAALSEGATRDLIFFAFDLLFAEGEDLRKLHLHERKARLHSLLEVQPRDVTARIRYVEHFEAAGDAVLQSACRMKLEGIISKRLDSPYRSGRVGDWLKTKCRAGQEVVIGGWTHEAGRFRSLLVGVYRDHRLVYAGRVGTGFGHDKLQRLLPKLKAHAREESPFSDGAPRASSDIRWVEPKLVAEIEFAGWTSSGQIRQAAFKSLRKDKPATQIVAEKPAPIATQVAEPVPKGVHQRAGTTRNAERESNIVMGVLISSPDKPLWPAANDRAAITKLDLARYFERMGQHLMPHIEGRPCSLIRAPDGIEGQRFFQRHAMRGTSSLLTLTQVPGDSKPYLQIDRVEGLIAVAQIAAVELHPWNCEPCRPDVPGRLVFDIDPAPDVAFEDVIAAAKELRERLEALGLVAFCKTTGGKGLHVVTPLAQPKNGALDWRLAKTFAQSVCAHMAEDSPDRYLIKMTKKLRTGRIFLDYLRNDRMSTAVAPFSPRAREGATVSMPLTWAQVKSGLDPTRYTMHTVPSLLSKLKAWQDYDESARPLEPAIRKLVNGRSTPATTSRATSKRRKSDRANVAIE